MELRIVGVRERLHIQVPGSLIFGGALSEAWDVGSIRLFGLPAGLRVVCRRHWVFDA